MTCTPETPAISFTSLMMSMQSRLPSSFWSWRAFEARDDRIGNVDARHVGADPAGCARRGERADADEDEALFVQAEVAHPLHELCGTSARRSSTGSARIARRRAIFLPRWIGRKSKGGANGLIAAPRKTCGGVVSLRPERNFAVVAHDADGLEQRHGIEVEDGLGAGLVARLHAVAGEAQDVVHAHRRRAEHVALDGDAVLVAAGDLHDRRIAHAGQQRADADRRHVAVGAGGIDGVDAVDPAVEDRARVRRRPRIGAVGRVELGRHREFAAPQHALQPAARGMAGQRIERQVEPGRILVGWMSIASWRRLPAGVSRAAALRVRAARPRFRAATGRPASARSRIVSPSTMLREPSQALTQTQGMSAIDLAIAVGAHAAAGAVAQLLGAVHRAGHAGGRQDALAAHAAVEQHALDAALERSDGPLQPVMPIRSISGCGGQQGLCRTGHRTIRASANCESTSISAVKVRRRRPSAAKLHRACLGLWRGGLLRRRGGRRVLTGVSSIVLASGLGEGDQPFLRPLRLDLRRKPCPPRLRGRRETSTGSALRHSAR